MYLGKTQKVLTLFFIIKKLLFINSTTNFRTEKGDFWNTQKILFAVRMLLLLSPSQVFFVLADTLNLLPDHLALRIASVFPPCLN